MRVHFSDWTLDFETRELRRGGQAIHLSPKAFRLLEVLVEQRPAALSKERLFEAIWPETFVAESNLASLVKEIRAALQDRARESAVIRTVFGYGYAFAAEATVEASTRPRVQSVAVFPFANVGRLEWDYVSDAIAESLLNALTRLRGVRVVPRSTSFRYGSAKVDLKSAAREMRVEAVVTGRVTVREETLTVQVELVDIKADSQIWGGRFQGRTSELEQLQRRIETEITARVAEHASPETAVGETTPRNNEAYHLFLRGRHQWNRRDAQGFRRAIEAFRAASEMDSDFARAHAALAEAYVVLGTREIDLPKHVFPLARQAAERALAVDPSLAAAHSAKGAEQELYEWEWSAAEESHQTAVSLDPHYASAAQWLALHYARRGRHEEARRWIDRALELEPLSPIINTNAALIAWLAHDFNAGARHSEIAIELSPHFEAAHMIRGVLYIQIDPRRAVEELEEAARLSARQPYALSHLAYAYAAAGRGKDALRIRDEVSALATGCYVSPSLTAIIDLAVDNREGALLALEVAAEHRSPGVSYLLGDPRLDVLRDEAQFRFLVRSIYGDKGSAPASTPPV